MGKERNGMTKNPMIECQIKAPAIPLDGYYWIAINGASCAASLIGPLSVDVQCKPTPQNLIGFPTREEAIDMQRFCLTGPIEEVHERLMELAQREDVVIKVFKNSEPPTHGPTLWIDAPETPVSAVEVNCQNAENPLSVKGERLFIKVVPTPGSSFEQDMKERDATVEHIQNLLAAGAEAAVTLHCDLDEEEIERAIARWKGVPVKMYLVDGSESQRRHFLKRWKQHGGPEVITGTPIPAGEPSCGC
jgi:hypothetical protein